MSFDLETFLPYRLHQAAERTSQQFQCHYRETYGLNRTEWRALFHIGSYGPISATEISRRSRLDKAILSRAVLKLEESKWVERQYRTNDRRGHDLALTGAGRQVFSELRQLAAAFNRRLIEKLGPANSRKLLQALHALEDFAETALTDS